MIEIVIFSAVSTLLYHLGMGFLLFLIPIQMVLMRRGERPFLQALVLSFVFIMLFRLVSMARLEGSEEWIRSLVLVEVFCLASLLAGLAFINFNLSVMAQVGVPRLDRVMRLLAATAAVALISLPLILFLRSSKSFNTGVKEMFEIIAAYFNRSLQQGGDTNLIQAEALIEITREFLLRSFLSGYFLILTFSWWTGSHLGARSVGRKAEITRLINFRIPESFIWPLIGGLALVLIDIPAELGPLGYLAWNVSLIFLFLYGLAGAGIIKFLFQKHNVYRGMRWTLIGIYCILLLIPKINIVAVLVVPGIGISDIWLNYRNKERSERKQ